MTNTEDEATTSLARQAIHAAYGTPDDEYGATLFVSHHLEELDAQYWETTFQNPAPEPGRIIDGLIVAGIRRSENATIVDFTLPASVTDNVICVTLDDDGEIQSVTMES